MFVIFGRKRIAWSRLLVVLSVILIIYWCSQKSILPHQGVQERKILAQTTTLRIDPKDEKAEFDESEVVDPSISITIPTGDELTEKPPPVNNTGKGPLPEDFAKKLKDYIFEKEGRFLVPESSEEIHFYLFGRDIESLNLHRSLFSNERGVFNSPSFDCHANFSEAEFDALYKRNSIFKDIFGDRKTLKPEYIPPICSLFKIKVRELDSLAQVRNEESSQVVFNFRDPRGRLAKVKEAKSLCSQMASDLQLIEKIPHDHVVRLRFEDLFAKPSNEIQRLLKKLRIGLNPKDERWEKDLSLPSGWEFTGNSLNKINSWKSKLSLEDIKVIENECREVISKMEYHIVS